MENQTEEEVEQVVETPEAQSPEAPPVEETQETVELRVQKPEEAAPELPALDESRRAAIGQEWLENEGNLSDETWQYLENQTLNRDFVQEYMQLQQEVAGYRTEALMSRLGGTDVVKQALEWAGQNLSPEAQASIDSQLASGDLNVQENTLRGLMASAGIVGKLAKGSSPATGSGDKPFESMAELQAAQRDPRYKTNAEGYRTQVERRVAISDPRKLV